jgi:hypothetical protein
MEPLTELTFLSALIRWNTRDLHESRRRPLSSNPLLSSQSKIFSSHNCVHSPSLIHPHWWILPPSERDTRFVKSSAFRIKSNTILNVSFDPGRKPKCRSQWPRALRHELSLSARTLGSWVRISWMSVCVCSMFMLSCVPCDGLISRPVSPTDSVKIKKVNQRPRCNKGL